MSIASGLLSPTYRAAPFPRIELPVGGRKVELVAGSAGADPVEGTRILVDDEPVSLTYREWVTHTRDGNLETIEDSRDSSQ